MTRDTPTMESINTTEARQHFAEIVNQVYRRERRYVIEKSGIPVAAVVSVDDARRLDRLDERRRQALAALDAVRESFRDVPQEEFDRQSALALREVRAERGIDRT